MTTTAYRIPLSRLPELEKRIAKINKRAEKLEKPPVSMTTGATEEVTVSQGGSLALRMGTKFTYTAINVEVTGQTPVVNGWEFLTTVLHRPAGNEFVNLPGTSEADLSSFVFVDKNCDHCHKKRVRNATFVIRHIETGELKQVGSTCLGDFTGYHSPQAAAKACENIYALFMDLRTWGGSTAGRTTKKFFLQEWLAFVSYGIRVHGFVSRKRSWDTGEEATADRAKRHILQAAEDANGTEVVPNDADWSKAWEVITWVRDREHKEALPTDDFHNNLVAAFASDEDDAVSESEMALTAAAFPVMWRAEKEAKQAQAQTTQAYYGEVGSTYNMDLTVERIGAGWASDYGWTRPMDFVDANGNYFTWFCTASRVEVEVGKTYKVRGKVRKQEVNNYTGNKTTYLTRCKVTE